ncbi:MAG: hypothetical protein QF660_02050 [Anaerolineales bacterium]|jgi:3-deoxy-7-phosphoheptulonate synthase|nr:hypothetical protein [Anaerolineales bacterium]
MIVVMRVGTTKKQIAAVVARIEKDGFSTHLSEGSERTIIGVIGNDRPIESHNYEVLEGVEKTAPVLKPFKLVSRDFQQDDTIVNVNGVGFGASSISIIAGPCSVEDRAQVLESPTR